MNDFLEEELVESLEAKELGDLTVDYSELALDSVLDDGAIKDIPFLRTIVGFAKVGLNIRDRMYFKKIYNFLKQVGQTTQEEREAFVKKYCNNKKRFGETILLIVEQADRMEKTTLIGKIFKACILGQLQYDDAIKLSEMVNRAFWSDLENFFSKNKDSTNEGCSELALAGLCNLYSDGTSMGMSSSGVMTYPSVIFKVNKYGRMLYCIGNDIDASSYKKVFLKMIESEKMAVITYVNSDED